jgi:hypothetical protein
MELVVKFCMIYFTRSGISFPGFDLVPMSTPLNVRLQSLEDNMKMDLSNIGHELVDCAHLLQDRDQ